MLLVVRHAEAGDKSTWTGPDTLRPLSPSGHLQAEGLVVRLEDYPIERILCSPTLRCRQTVQPLARDRMLEIEPVPALGVEASPAQLLERIFGTVELSFSQWSICIGIAASLVLVEELIKLALRRRHRRVAPATRLSVSEA